MNTVPEADGVDPPSPANTLPELTVSASQNLELPQRRIGLHNADFGYYETINVSFDAAKGWLSDDTVEVPVRPEGNFKLDPQTLTWVLFVPEPPTPEELRAAMPKLAKWRVEAIIDLHGQQRQIDLRGRIDTEIEALPEPVRTIAKSKRVYVTEYSRTDQLFDLIGSAIAMSPEEIDALWLEASLL